MADRIIPVVVWLGVAALFVLAALSPASDPPELVDVCPSHIGSDTVPCPIP